jgi:multisubunit Na+/H+ antiporter MnhF subunit
MNWWLAGAVVLVVGGLVPGLWLASRGDPVSRLVGLELASSVTVLVLMVLSQVSGQAQYLIVPLVLVLLSFAGTLVFVRLLAPRS